MNAVGRDEGAGRERAKTVGSLRVVFEAAVGEHEGHERQRKLAGFTLRRHADRVQSRYRDGCATVLFYFDH